MFKNHMNAEAITNLAVLSTQRGTITKELPLHWHSFSLALIYCYCTNGLRGTNIETNQAGFLMLPVALTATKMESVESGLRPCIVLVLAHPCLKVRVCQKAKSGYDLPGNGKEAGGLSESARARMKKLLPRKL